MASNEKKAQAAEVSTAPVKKVTEKPTFFGRIKKWFREMKSELKKVVWPTPQQTAKNTGVALAVMAVSAVVLWGFDSLAQACVKALISLVG